MITRDDVRYILLMTWVVFAFASLGSLVAFLMVPRSGSTWELTSTFAMAIALVHFGFRNRCVRLENREKANSDE